MADLEFFMISARSVLVDYNSLATTTKETEENLFGYNLTQDIKDANIRRKNDTDYGYNPKETHG